MPHSTQVAGYAAIHGGDDRYIGNIFLGGDPASAYGPTSRFGDGVGYGTAGYDGHPASLEDYIAQVDDPSRGDHERFMGVKQPVYIRDNVYALGAGAFEAEYDPLVLADADVSVAVVDEGDEVYLETQLPEAFDTAPHRARHRQGPRARPLRRRGLRGARRHPGDRRHRPRRRAQDRRAGLSRRTDRHARIGLLTHPRVVMDEGAVRARMNTGELYVDQGEGLEALEAERVHGKELLYDYNHTRPGQTEERLRLLRELLGQSASRSGSSHRSWPRMGRTSISATASTRTSTS